MRIYKHLETTGNVLKLAESRNLSDSELARGLGVTPQAINKWRNCGGGLSKLLLVNAALFFNVKVDDILVFEEGRDVLLLYRLNTKMVPDKWEPFFISYIRTCVFRTSSYILPAYPKELL